MKLKDNPTQIIDNVKKQTTEEVEVVLMHEKAQTLQALPEIIKFYKEQGYGFGVYNDEEHFRLNFQKINVYSINIVILKGVFITKSIIKPKTISYTIKKSSFSLLQVAP